MGLKPQIISQVAEQLPKIFSVSRSFFFFFFLSFTPPEIYTEEMSLSQQSRRDLNLNKQEVALLFPKEINL